MKKLEIIELNNAIDSAKELQGSAKFRYALLRNRDKIAPEIKRLKEIEEGYMEGIKAFSEEKNKLIIKLGKDNGSGMISIDQNDKEGVEKFKTEILDIQKKHKNELDEFDKNMKEYQTTVLEEELEDVPTFYEIPIENVPDNLPEKILEVLFKFGII